ncbi:hypothetical protein [Streptomyces sp. NPDC048644]|uniref:hypothetical protein n=1 Tax=Streptomyces sp. NPDC048644 TaxID=3365582 RepID=UPI003717DF6C
MPIYLEVGECEGYLSSFSPATLVFVIGVCIVMAGASLAGAVLAGGAVFGAGAVFFHTIMD